MIQDAKNPIQFGEKLTREFADPTIFLNLQPSLYKIWKSRNVLNTK